ncbi:MAG: CPBP family glutamic-type intramembrane protease [Thermofilum sp.]
MRVTLEDAWPLVCLAYTAAASTLSPTLAYILLLLYAAPLLKTGGVRDRRTRRRDAVVVPLLVLAGHLPAAGFAFSYNPSAVSLVFAAVSGIVEEMFFRGFLLEKAGLAIQAFVFALTHLSLSDPVSLVLTALLWPHYFALGLTFGVIADRRSWSLSAAAHAAYNVAAVTYGLPLELRVVAVLLAADMLNLLFVTLYFHTARRCNV